MSNPVVRRNQSTTWYIDLDKVRKLINDEKAVRGLTVAAISQETGILAMTISGFLNGAGLSTNGVVSLIRWSGKKVDGFVVRRREVVARTENKQDREMRLLLQYLNLNGIEVEVGESPAVAAIRAIGNLKRGDNDA